MPHFEKMLYDNAQLAHAYLEAYRATGEERHRLVVESTLDFVLRELATSDGGFASALDADSQGEEGRFYVWTDGELRAVLTNAGLAASEVDDVARYWGVTPGGNWEGHSILHVAGPAPAHTLLDRARTALLTARATRVVAGTLLEFPDLFAPDASSELRNWLGRYNAVEANEAAMLRVWVDGALQDPALRAQSAPPLDWGRRRLAHSGIFIEHV